MNYATIKKHDVANGVGVRVSLFVSGCTHRCKGCFNAEAWDFSFGKEFTEETEREIVEALAPSYIAGLSLLGGEPFESRQPARARKTFTARTPRISAKDNLVLHGISVRLRPVRGRQSALRSDGRNAVFHRRSRGRRVRGREKGSETAIPRFFQPTHFRRERVPENGRARFLPPGRI